MQKGFIVVNDGKIAYNDTQIYAKYTLGDLKFDEFLFSVDDATTGFMKTIEFDEGKDVVIIIGKLNHSVEECFELAKMFEMVNLKKTIHLISEIIGVALSIEQEENIQKLLHIETHSLKIEINKTLKNIKFWTKFSAEISILKIMKKEIEDYLSTVRTLREPEGEISVPIIRGFTSKSSLQNKDLRIEINNKLDEIVLNTNLEKDFLIKELKKGNMKTKEIEGLFTQNQKMQSLIKDLQIHIDRSLKQE